MPTDRHGSRARLRQWQASRAWAPIRHDGEERAMNMPAPAAVTQTIIAGGRDLEHVVTWQQVQNGGINDGITETNNR